MHINKPAIFDGDAPGSPGRVVLRMMRYHEGRERGCCQAAGQNASRRTIQPCIRFIQKKQLRRTKKRLCQAKPAPHASRITGHLPLGVCTETACLQRLLHPCRS